MNKPVTIDYDSITKHHAEGIDFVIDAESEVEVTISHTLIIAHDRDKKTVDVPESFALRHGLI